jgi:excisionase family DNA binding protein
MFDMMPTMTQPAKTELPEVTWLKIAEVAGHVRVSTATVHQWCKEGRLPAARIGRHWRINRADLDAFMAKRTP